MSAFIVVMWIAAIILCYILAQKNGRNEGVAVILGVLFGWIAVIGYLIAGKSFEKKLSEARKLGQI